MITTALIKKIRNWHERDSLSIRQIALNSGLSRNTVKKYLLCSPDFVARYERPLNGTAVPWSATSWHC
jgi:transposase